MKKISEILARRGSAVEPAVLPSFGAYNNSQSAQFLRQLMQQNYTVANLKNETPEDFQAHILSLIGHRDAAIEGYTDTTHQRDMSIQFEWGHNHDFGAFSLQGAMRDRHIEVLATFMEECGVPERSLAGKRVLDIGCWTGGMSLLLAAMGAQVFAIEEVRKYADCVNYMKNAFGLDNLTVENRSLYSLTDEKFYDRFDIAIYSGVLYHVTDPVLSLRIVFNSLKDGGRCLLETMAREGKGSFCGYYGASDTLKRSADGGPRAGWNWFVPSLEAVSRLMTDVGFDVRHATLHEGARAGARRALALGLREKHVDMLRAGLSRPDIR
ncbi:MAG TPA: methyltransferase domain-containing protein [Pyrinomonadaceae bacterium]|jgi:2-polyprenyl-3-methyl-5-hydroxy-6-metoxy-1,4-benzoquinol methylase